MVRYWFGFTPLVVVLALVPLTLPWLGVFALLVFVLIAVASLGALAFGIVLALDRTVRATGRLRHRSIGALRPPATLPVSRPSARPPRSVPASAAVLLASSRHETERLP